jgi:hypothetical protein
VITASSEAVPPVPAYRPRPLISVESETPIISCSARTQFKESGNNNHNNLPAYW